MIVGAPLQSVTKVRPSFASLSQFELTSKGRVVQPGHDKPPSLVVHWDEVLHPPWHCILTVRGILLALGTPSNAFVLMFRTLALYCTVRVLIPVPWNACSSIKVQPEVRIPQSSENTYAGFPLPEYSPSFSASALMIPQFGSVTEPSAAPNTAASGSGVRICSAFDTACAAMLVFAQIVMLTDNTPSPSVSISETTMSEGSIGTLELVR